MNRCPSCNAMLKRKKSHCDQCGTPIKENSSKSGRLLKGGILFGFVLLFTTGSWLWSELNEPVQTREAKTAKDVQQSLAESMTPDETNDSVMEETPSTEESSDSTVEPVTAADMDAFMNSFVGAFTDATYSKDSSRLSSYIVPGSAFETNTINYLKGTLFANNITEDQLETTVRSIQVEGENRDSLEDGETANVTTLETYRIAKPNSVVIASFETTYAVVYENGELKIAQNLASKELSRTVE